MSNDISPPQEDEQRELFTSSRGISYSRPVAPSRELNMLNILLENTTGYSEEFVTTLEQLRLKYMEEANNQ